MKKKQKIDFAFNLELKINNKIFVSTFNTKISVSLYSNSLKKRFFLIFGETD